jgi:hypothetical protein
MNSPTGAVAEEPVDDDVVAAFEALADAFDGVLDLEQIPGLAEGREVAVMAVVEKIVRRATAVQLHLAAQVDARSPKGLGAERLCARFGCRTPVELVARVTGVSEATAARRISLGKTLVAGTSPTLGVLPSRFPVVAAAVAAGELGEDSARAVVSVLGPIQHRADPEDWAEAERCLVEAATTAGMPADLTRVQALQWKVVLDPDGVEPDGEEAMRHRGLVKLGARDGVIRYRLDLVPEIAGKLDTAVDAIVSPTTSPVFLSEDQAVEQGVRDERTGAQRRHDAFASLIDAAARCAEVPSIGGAAPTVLVRVDQADLVNGRGAGWIDGIQEPIPMAGITQFVCAGGVQKVLFNTDRAAIGLGSPQRCFTPQQRRAIAVRDGGCVIPGCSTPVGWCEIHHVQEYSRGGPTHTDNGVALCWFHHRSIDQGGWHVSMRHGVPHVRPPGWIDPAGAWRPVGINHDGPRRHRT